MRIRLLFAAVSALITAAAPPTPEAPDADFDAARASFRAGLDHLDAGAPDAAIAAFTASLERRFSLPAQYNLGLAHRAAGQRREAIAAFEAFLDAATAAGHTDGVEHARTLVAALRAELVHVALSMRNGASAITLDGAPIADGDGELGLVLDPGAHVIRFVDASGASQTRDANLAPGSHVAIVLDAAPLPELTRAPPPLVPPPTVADDDDGTWVWWIGGLAIVAAASAAVTYAITRPAAPDYDGGTHDVVLRGLAPRGAFGGAR